MSKLNPHSKLRHPNITILMDVSGDKEKKNIKTNFIEGKNIYIIQIWGFVFLYMVYMSFIFETLYYILVIW